jgi:hypothetical protein
MLLKKKSVAKDYIKIQQHQKMLNNGQNIFFWKFFFSKTISVNEFRLETFYVRIRSNFFSTARLFYCNHNIKLNSKKLYSNLAKVEPV